MPSDVIPEDIRLFILQNIDTIAQLEGLLILRANASAQWDIPSLSQRLYVTEPEAEELMTLLAARGLLATAGNPPLYHYKPKTTELKEKVDALAGIYRRYLVAVTDLVHAKPKNRIREFANAFWIRKD